MDIIEDYKLVLLNDDVNSFSYIMACLIRFCMHEPQQAEQCAMIADNVCRCTVKHGSFYFSKLLHWVAIVINQRKANYLIINYHLNHCIIGHYHP